MKDDPSFIFPVSNTTSSGPKQLRTPVAVHKTNISSHRFAESQPEDQDSDPTKFCPLHKMPHPLLECRAFRTKTIKDRKAFLKENNICYKCCSSSTHFAKDCKVSVKCTECDSTEHNTALHPRPTPRTFPPVHRDKEQGGETKDSSTDAIAITSQCTEVCKGSTGGRSCSKICLVRVYPKGRRDKAVKLYVILDDQSNKSLARSMFFDILNLKGPSSPYSLRTCAGTVETAGRRADSLQIESMNGKTCLPLPTIIECNQMPHNRSEIPTPEQQLTRLT